MTEQKPSFAELVEGAAQARGNPPVARSFIEEALRKINANEVEVTKYPSGSPTLRAVYEVAVLLESEATVKN